MSFTGADLIAKGLADLGVSHVFAIVSIHNMPILDAINRLGKTAIIDVRHEQAGTHAADGYSRATGKMGVMIASTGPGTTNTVTGLYEAEAACSKVLVITGQVETAFFGKGLSYVHEAENQSQMLATVCRRVERPRTIDQLAWAFNNVVSDMHIGRGAPGALEIHIDLQYAEAKTANFQLPEPPASVDSDAIEEVVQQLQKAGRRIIIAGGGVIAANASAELTALAERLDTPVITTAEGRGSIPEDHPLCAGNFYAEAAMYQAIQDADVTLAIGTKFGVGVEGSQAQLKPPGALIQIDIDPKIISRTHHASFGVNADAKAALAVINASLKGQLTQDGQFNQRVFEARDTLHDDARKTIGKDFTALMQIVREKMPRDANWIRDSTIIAYFYANKCFPVYEPRTSMSPITGAIGPGLPLAIGAVVGSNRKTVLVNGDGGFMFHATEIATAAQYQLPLVICVFNDGGYGVLRWLQSNRFGRINETELGVMDFAKMAESMGMPGKRVQNVGEFEATFDDAMATKGPYLIDIDMNAFEPTAISTEA